MSARLHWLSRCGALALAATAAALPANAQIGVGDAGPFVIRNATVVTGTGQRIENGSIVIQDGKIAAVGANVQAPAGAKEIDARGKFVYPGMMDSYTPIGLSEIGGIATMNLTSELGEYNPQNRALVALNVDSEMLGVTRSNGVTHVITAPSGGMISGQAALINLSGWTWEDLAVRPTAAFVVNYPRAGGGGRGGGRGGGEGEGGAAAAQRVAEQVNGLKDRLRTAKAYDVARTNGSQEFDIHYEAMRPLVRGEVPALVSADTEEQIRGAIALADTFGLEVIVLGGDEAYKVADVLAQKQIPVVLGSIQSTPPADAPYDAIYAQPGVLVRAGVKIAFSTGGASNARHVPYHAALATAYGLEPDDALKALTLWPAEIFGVADQLGSIEVGKMANVFISDGDPLDVRTHMTDIFIEGMRIPPDDRHRLLYEKYNARPRR